MRKEEVLFRRTPKLPISFSKKDEKIPSVINSFTNCNVEQST